jgi:hypothetical protein
MLALVVGLALAAGSNSANGQTTSHAVTAEIPFDFIVGNKTLAAGKYIVSSATSDAQAVRILNRDAKSAAFRLSIQVPDKSPKRIARLVFHRYGQQYFLAEIWSGESWGRQLTQCSHERNLRRELASNASKIDSATGSYQLVEVLAMVR